MADTWLGNGRILLIAVWVNIFARDRRKPRFPI